MKMQKRNGALVNLLLLLLIAALYFVTSRPDAVTAMAQLTYAPNYRGHAENAVALQFPVAWNAAALESILDTLAERYPDTTVVLTLGEQGAAAARGSLRARVPARQTTVVDTTAAGDTFTGYFLRRALEGASLEEALTLAAAASALAVSRPGAADAVPGYTEVLAAL